jgi:hypothetical protein
MASTPPRAAPPPLVEWTGQGGSRSGGDATRHTDDLWCQQRPMEDLCLGAGSWGPFVKDCRPFWSLQSFEASGNAAHRVNKLETCQLRPRGARLHGRAADEARNGVAVRRGATIEFADLPQARGLQRNHTAMRLRCSTARLLSKGRLACDLVQHMHVPLQWSGSSRGRERGPRAPR